MLITAINNDKKKNNVNAKQKLRSKFWLGTLQLFYVIYLGYKKKSHVNIFCIILKRKLYDFFFLLLWNNCYMQQFFIYIIDLKLLPQLDTDFRHYWLWAFFASLGWNVLQNYIKSYQVGTKNSCEVLKQNFDLSVLCSNDFFLVLFTINLICN